MYTLESIFYSLPAIAALGAGAVLLAVACGLAVARGRRWMAALLIAALALHAAVFLHGALSYTLFPYEGKSVVEGVVLYNAMGYMRGEQPYHPPTEVPFRSLVYPPVHEMALAAFMFLIGPSLFAARLFSLLCTLALAALAGSAVWRQTRSALASLFGGAMVIAAYGLTGHWLEQARNDALMALLVMAGLLLAARAMERGRFPVAGLIALLLALYTKQVALFAPAAVAAALWFQSPRRAIIWAGSFALAALALFLAMQIWSGGWFSFYTLRVPFSAGVEWDKFDIASTFFSAGWLLLWGVAVLVAPAAFRREASPTARVWVFALALGLPMCLLQSFKWGAALNAFIPALPMLAVLSGWALHEAITRAGRDRPTAVGVLALALMQAAMLSYQPLVPTRADYEGQRRIAEWVRAAPGEVFVSVFSSQSYLNGKRYFGDDVSIGDLRRADAWRGSELIERIRRREFSLLILRPILEPDELAEAVRANYRPAERIPFRTDITRWPYMEVHVPADTPWRPQE